MCNIICIIICRKTCNKICKIICRNCKKCKICKTKGKSQYVTNMLKKYGKYAKYGIQIATCRISTFHSADVETLLECHGTKSHGAARAP